ncbi:unnamed protein product [Strongylus vulgaris]|uniref:EML-like first beta-propeller domain-containing protein n=1 Tax=Strongylus vulgaris TaxID=40348 RepID=A0A3P7IUC3_STRVU|nr:unnamed protein product [Strongylus vulgaris]
MQIDKRTTDRAITQLPYVRLPGLCFLQGDYVIDAPCSFEKAVKIGVGGDCLGVVGADFEKAVKIGVGGDCLGVAGAEYETISMLDDGASGVAYSYGIRGTGNVELLLSLGDSAGGKPPLYFALLHPDVCVHPNRVVVASGQSSRHQRERHPDLELRDPYASILDLEADLENSLTEAHVRIWDSVTLSTLKILSGSKAMFEKAVSCLAFSAVDGGTFLACTDDSYQHTLSIWRWGNEAKAAEAKVSMNSNKYLLHHDTALTC